MSVLGDAQQQVLRAAAAVEAQLWPGLGFNPAKGDLAAVDALVDKVNRAGQQLRATFDALDAIRNQQAIWQGEAARNFAGKLEELPKYLDHAGQSMTKAGKALLAWSDQLTAHQRTATDLEHQARWWKEQRERLDESVRQAQANPAFAWQGRTFGTPQEAQQAQAQIDQASKLLAEAQHEAGKAWESLNEVLEQAHRLQDAHADDERAAADGVRRANDGVTPPEPGFFEGLLETLGEVAGVIGTVAGVLACFPPFAPIAGPIAIAASGVALASNAGKMAITGDFDGATLATDALGMIPGVGAVKAGIGAAKTTGQSIRTVQGLRTAARAAGDDVAQPSVLAQKFGTAFGQKLSVEGQKRLGQMAEGTVNMGLQAPTVVKWAQGGHDSVARDMQAVGAPAGLANSAYGAADTLYPTIGRLARAVG